MAYRIDPAELVDISVPLSESTPAWPGDTPFCRYVREEYGFRTSRLVMSSHTGTHMDAPAHLCRCSETIDAMGPERLILPAVVVTVPQGEVLSPDGLDGLELQGCALLLKTGTGIGGTECRDGHLTVETARMAVDSGVLTVGTDAMSVDAHDSADVHGILLGSSVLILENLILDQVDDGRYLLLCFPLRISDGDGSPVRAYLHPIA